MPQIIAPTVISPLNDLQELALSLGASGAKVIASEEIVVREELANFCREPRCESYGLSASCPPHVLGPTAFRQLQQTHRQAIVVKIDVPAAALFSEEKKEIMRLLHRVVATVEQRAVELGYCDSRAFAGGSCKRIFCEEEEACSKLSRGGACLSPQEARPSMSGFGIDVVALMESCGWSSKINVRHDEATRQKMSWVAGLVLLGSFFP